MHQLVPTNLGAALSGVHVIFGVEISHSWDRAHQASWSVKAPHPEIAVPVLH